MYVSFLIPDTETCFHGLRMTAEEYFKLGETVARYELIDGVVCLTPSPTPRHQHVVGEVVMQLFEHVKRNPCGEVVMGDDTYMGRGLGGGDLVYRPDVSFFCQGRLASLTDYPRIPPNLVVEVVTSVSRRMDNETKRSDYERAGVDEYWVIDSELESLQFLRMSSGSLVEVEAVEEMFKSSSVTGFTLDLSRIRKVFVE